MLITALILMRLDTASIDCSYDGTSSEYLIRKKMKILLYPIVLIGETKYLAGFLYCVRDILHESSEGGAGDDDLRLNFGLSRGGGRGGRSYIFFINLGVTAV